jgi:hypothetical protein
LLAPIKNTPGKGKAAAPAKKAATNRQPKTPSNEVYAGFVVKAGAKASRGPRSLLIGIVTGYALTEDDGMWRPHGFALSKAKGVISIIETTSMRTAYFGIAWEPR